MSHAGYAGLRFGGGTQITRCCGTEALAVYDLDRFGEPKRELPRAPNGEEASSENFPDTDFICPDCGRTWPLDCSHDDVGFIEPVERLQDGRLVATGECFDCDQRVQLQLDLVDAYTLGGDA